MLLRPRPPCPEETTSKNPHHRRRAHRHRAGLRVRLLRDAGRQGARGGGLRGRPRQLEPGDDHDRSGARAPDVRRAARAARRSTAHHRARAARRDPADARRADRAEPRARARRATASSKRLGVELLGAQPDAIRKAEDRALFKEAMEKIGLSVPARGLRALRRRGAGDRRRTRAFPAILRPSFTHGRHRAAASSTDETELEAKVAWALAPVAHARGAHRRERARLEGVRARGHPRPRRQLHRRLLDREHRSRWACTPATRSPSRPR